MAKQITRYEQLYYGDNGAHEFWENADGTLIIFRNHHEKWWLVYVDDRWKGTPDACYIGINSALRYLRDKRGIKATFETGQTWVQPANRPNANMVLQSVA